MWSELHNSPHTELKPPVPFTSRPLNTRTMKETFKSFVELLISVALDEDVMTALERANGKKKKTPSPSAGRPLWNQRLTC